MIWAALAPEFELRNVTYFKYSYSMVAQGWIEGAGTGVMLILYSTFVGPSANPHYTLLVRSVDDFEKDKYIFQSHKMFPNTANIPESLTLRHVLDRTVTRVYDYLGMEMDE